MREHSLHVLQAEEAAGARAGRQEEPGAEKARGRQGSCKSRAATPRLDREAGWMSCVGKTVWMLAFSPSEWEPWQVLSRGDVGSDGF